MSQCLLFLFSDSRVLPVCLSSDPNALGHHGTDHALIGGVVAVVVFVTLCLIIVLGRYLARHKGKITVDPAAHTDVDLSHWTLPDVERNCTFVHLVEQL